MFGLHGGSLQPSCHSVLGMHWCRGDPLKWLDWREKGTAVLSKQCSDTAEQLACFHHRCGCQGLTTPVAHMNGYRDASGKLWGASCLSLSSHFQGMSLTAFLSNAVVFQIPTGTWGKIRERQENLCVMHMCVQVRILMSVAVEGWYHTSSKILHLIHWDKVPHLNQELL